MNWVDEITQTHNELAKLFKRAIAIPSNDNIRKLHKMFFAHANAEEQVIYKHLDKELDKELWDQQTEAKKEINEVEQVESFHDRKKQLTEIFDAVKHHVKIEDDNFPSLYDRLSTEQNKTLHGEYHKLFVKMAK